MGEKSAFFWWLLQFVYQQSVNEGIPFYSKILAFGLENFETSASGLIVTSFSGNGTSTSRTFSKSLPPSVILELLKALAGLYHLAVEALKKEGIENPTDEEIYAWMLEHSDDIFFTQEVTDYRYVLP